MTYRLTYTHRAARDIAALDATVKQRVGKTLLRYQHDPLAYAEPLKQWSSALTGSASVTIVSCLILKGIRSLSCAWGTEEKSTDDRASLQSSDPGGVLPSPAAHRLSASRSDPSGLCRAEAFGNSLADSVSFRNSKRRTVSRLRVSID